MGWVKTFNDMNIIFIFWFCTHKLHYDRFILIMENVRSSQCFAKIEVFRCNVRKSFIIQARYLLIVREELYVKKELRGEQRENTDVKIQFKPSDFLYFPRSLYFTIFKRF